MDKNSRKREDKDTGISKLEPHCKNLILNVMPHLHSIKLQTHPKKFSWPSRPKEANSKLNNYFLSMSKSWTEPSTQTKIVSILWNCDLFLDGVTIIFYPKKNIKFFWTKKRTEFGTGWERALIFKKLLKQNKYLPTTVMDMRQKFAAAISLCLGPKSHWVSFFKDWTDPLL